MTRINLVEKKQRQRHWLTGWNRQRPERLVLSCTHEEAAMVRGLAAARSETVQIFLMSLVMKEETLRASSQRPSAID